MDVSVISLEQSDQQEINYCHCERMLQLLPNVTCIPVLTFLRAHQSFRDNFICTSHKTFDMITDETFYYDANFVNPKIKLRKLTLLF